MGCGASRNHAICPELFFAGQQANSRGEAQHYNGSDWETQGFADSLAMSGVSGSATDEVYAVGYDGRIASYDGSSWSEMSSGTTEHLFEVWVSNSGEAFAVGQSGTILYVPEPATLSLLMLAGLAVLKRRNRWAREAES